MSPLRDAQAYDADVPAVEGSFEDAPTVDVPSGPPEIKLRPSYVAVVAVIATLFSAAVVLLAFALTIRFLGL